MKGIAVRKFDQSYYSWTSIIQTWIIQIFQLSGFFNYPHLLSGPNFFMNINLSHLRFVAKLFSSKLSEKIPVGNEFVSLENTNQ